jgi:hypothetical protein
MMRRVHNKPYHPARLPLRYWLLMPVLILLLPVLVVLDILFPEQE